MALITVDQIFTSSGSAVAGSFLRGDGVWSPPLANIVNNQYFNPTTTGATVTINSASAHIINATISGSTAFSNLTTAFPAADHDGQLVELLSINPVTTMVYTGLGTIVGGLVSFISGAYSKYRWDAVNSVWRRCG